MSALVKTVALSLFVTSCLIRHARAEEIKRVSLDDVSSLALKIETDREVKVEGNGSVRIKTPWPVTVCLSEFTDVDAESATLVFRASVKCEDLKGTAFLEMWCDILGGQYFSRGMNSMITGTMDWKVIETAFALRKDQSPTKVTLNLIINGRGTVWIDDLVLMKAPLK